MKKIALFLCFAAVASTAGAQELQKNIFGARAGLTVSNLHIDESILGISPKSLTSFHIGVSDQILITRSIPLYFETGLYFTQKGCKAEGRMLGRDGSVTIKPSYIEVPLLATYHFDLNHGISLQPFAGVYVSYGIGGKAKVKAGDYSSQADLFRDSEYTDSYDDVQATPQIMKRADFGLRMGVAATYDRMYLGLGYELGLTDNVDNDSFGVGFAKNRSFTLSLGYNF